MNFDPFDTSILDFNSSLSLNSLKTDLFMKVTQVQQLNKELEKVMLMPKTRRRKWLKDNESFLTQMMEKLSTDSSLVLDGIDGDKQEIDLSVEYISSLRDVMNALNSILHASEKSRL
jgi:hypothetical protein